MQIDPKTREGARNLMKRALERPLATIGCLAAFAMVVLLACLVALGMRDTSVVVERSEADAAPADVGSAASVSVPDGEPAGIFVDVAGAVVAPGLVELEDGARVDDALEMAGGLASDADTSGINRAAKLTDGQKVYVPRVGEAVADTSQAGEGAASSADPAAPNQGLISINTASEAELDALPGVGPSTAKAIVEDRERNGAFSTLEDLMRVSGIGEKKFEKMRGSICL